jgi:transposase-like protein
MRNILMVKCPYCNYEGEFKFGKTWKFRFYDVKRMECPKCRGVFNYYKGVSSKGKTSEFVIRIKPKVKG